MDRKKELEFMCWVAEFFRTSKWNYNVNYHKVKYSKILDKNDMVDYFINTLQEFSQLEDKIYETMISNEKVLVRQKIDSNWVCKYFSHIEKDKENDDVCFYCYKNGDKNINEGVEKWDYYKPYDKTIVDFKKIPENAKVLVRNSEDENFKRACFKEYKEDDQGFNFICYKYGDQWCSDGKTSAWRECILYNDK